MLEKLRQKIPTSLKIPSISKKASRLIFAGIISLSGIGAMKLWFEMTKNKGRNSGAKPIAQLIRAVNDVQRKPAKKLIWQPALESEPLYAGESIRTSQIGEARIKFEQSGAIIDLDPDSAIVLEELDGNIALDFVKGNILVKADDSGGAAGAAGTGKGLTLKTGGKNIALGKSEVSLGKGSGGELDMQVLKGQVTSDGKILSQDELDGAKIRILKPVLGQAVYLNTKENEQAVFQWKALPKGYKVTLEIGDERDVLRPVANSESAGETGELKANVKIGKSYFRLVARSEDPKQPELSSSTARIQFLAKVPPIPLSPENEAIMAVNKSDPKVKLLWSNPAGFSKVILEVVTTPDFKEKVLRQDLTSANEFAFTPTKNGIYYWRVSGLLEGSSEVVSSKVQKFKLSLLDEIVPPELEKPANNDKIPEDQAKKSGVVISWKSAPGAEKYRVVVEKTGKGGGERGPASEKVFDGEGRQTQLSLKDLKPGNYTWTVASISKSGEVSKPSEKRSFGVQTLPVIKWTDGKLKEDYYYISLKPTVQLSWEKSESKATSWKVELKKEESGEKPIVEEAKNNGGEFKLPKDGIYVAVIEGFDDRGQLVSRSERRRIRVSPAPLLPAPQFAENLPEEIEATPAGNVRISWTSVNGASQYILSVKPADGSEAKELTFATLDGALKGLMPGQYKISLRSVDDTGRSGPEGKPRILKVPNVSNVKAPKLKGLKVK